MSEIWKPNVTVATLVECEGKLLLVEEETEDGLRFNQPAGHLEAGESLVEGAIRETLEETGYLVRPEYLVGVYRWDHRAKQRVYLRFAFAASVVQHEAFRPLDTGIVRALWLDDAELIAAAARFRSPMVARCIADYRAGRHHGLDLLHDLG
ncbi:ADP-ribose pyrophosphatase [Burkholderiales bacterium]|nr:MAG: NUDIX hydrolase [Burkholderiales bacterium]CAG0990746.1 ADP-ribose pyrophosphatase [Burkholderiales bacterium]